MDPKRLWNEAAPKIGSAIINTIRTMGLPKLGEGYLGADARDRFTTTCYGQVRQALLCDTQLHGDIIQEVATAYWSAADRGTIPVDASPGWVFVIVQRTTWRHATARAKSLFRCVEGAGETAAVDLVASPGDAEDRMDAHMVAGRLAELVAALDETDQRILAAKLENEYDELAVELGIKVGTLRTQACRICKKLREALAED